MCVNVRWVGSQVRLTDGTNRDYRSNKGVFLGITHYIWIRSIGFNQHRSRLLRISLRLCFCCVSDNLRLISTLRVKLPTIWFDYHV